MTFKQALQWIFYFPGGLLAAGMVSGLLIQLGDWLIGEHAIFSAIVIFFAWSIAPTVAVGAGFAISHATYEEDEPVMAVQWIMLSPFILICLLQAYRLVTGNIDSYPTEEFSSLTPQIQSLLTTAGLLVGTAINILTNITERILEECL